MQMCVCAYGFFWIHKGLVYIDIQLSYLNSSQITWQVLNPLFNFKLKQSSERGKKASA